MRLGFDHINLYILGKKMKISPIKYAILAALFAPVAIASAATKNTESIQLTEQLEALEQRLLFMETSSSSENNTVAKSGPTGMVQISNNAFNPAVSIIIDGVFADYKNDPKHYAIPGFALGGKAKLGASGFSLGHSELVFSSNIDSRFFGQFTLALDEHDGKTELKLEEAFFETLALGNGFTIRGGRFFSGIGYLNQQHQHAWDFYDAPLIYRALFGNQYRDDGLRVSYVAASDLFMKIGVEAFSGAKFPFGGHHDAVGSWTAFATTGGDIGNSHSWQAGLSYLQADNIERKYGGHAHAHGHDGESKTAKFKGDTNTAGFNIVYKWAPNGNFREQNLTVQFEYFKREDDGKIEVKKVKHDGHKEEKSSHLNAEQYGWYLQTSWQFSPQWRVGARYDLLGSDNRGDNNHALEDANLLANGHTPERSSLMLEWLPSKFSRVRLQYNIDDSGKHTDNQVFLQYTMSLGAHGAHAF